MADLDLVLVARDYHRASAHGDLRPGILLDEGQVVVILAKECTRKIIIVKFDSCSVFQRYYLILSVYPCGDGV